MQKSTNLRPELYVKYNSITIGTTGIVNFLQTKFEIITLRF